MAGSKRYESTGDVQEREQAADRAAVKTASLLEHIQTQIDEQRDKSAAEARAGKRRDWAMLTIALLTLGATVLFGILGLLY